MPANRSCLLLRSTLCGCSGRINSAWQHRSLTRCVSAGKGGCRSKLQAHICRSWDTVNDESARGQRTCCQALLDLFQVLLQALPLPIQLCVFLLQVLNPAVSAIVWATATTWTASQRPRTHGGQIGTRPSTEMFAKFKGTDHDRMEIGEYCVQNTALPFKISQNLGIVPALLEMAQACYVRVEWVLVRGQGSNRREART